ncbi:PspC domain-containing protein [uncultured Sphingomonas sp.]|uniref:PspC domain-containing protein n=1 Tax=uncultured Sphingomonas sp. TaxID=158754 RepID=UPI0035C9696F
MPASPSPLFDRPDTFFGVCEGLGQDLGFNANFLRVLLGVAVLWNPGVVIATYLVLGLAVALARWIYPIAIDQAAAQAGAN